MIELLFFVELRREGDVLDCLILLLFQIYLLNCLVLGFLYCVPVCLYECHVYIKSVECPVV